MRAIALLAVVVLAASACTEDPVVLATVSEHGHTTPEGARCVANDDCPAGSFCERVGCEAAAGSCRPFPVVCPDDASPVCGCDGITYFNECLRRAAGASEAQNGECASSGTPCHASSECPAGSCALLVGTDPRQCAPGLVGRCWVLPTRCPPESEAGPDRWAPCVEPPPPGETPPAPPCIDTCTAIKTGLPHLRELSCP